MDEQILTVREASKILHVHCNTIRRWSNKDILRSIRMGPRGDRRFLEEDVRLLLLTLNTNAGNPKTES